MQSRPAESSVGGARLAGNGGAPDRAQEALEARLHELSDVDGAIALLDWDQETMMPPRASGARAEQLGTLRRLRHELLIGPELGELLVVLPAEDPAADADAGGEPEVPADRNRALARVTREDRDKALRVPSSLLAELTRAGSRGKHAWALARAANDFDAFLPYLREVIELRRRYIDCFPDVEHPYDALLDDYEPGMRTAEVRAVFARLRDGLEPLVTAIAAAREAGRGPTPLSGPFPSAAQQRLVRSVLLEIGFDDERYRLDESAHPFCTDPSLDDHRITARWGEESLESLFAGMHEFGHALYEAQISPALARTPLCTGVSMGMHESQSRLWENMVGRSRPFCEFVLDRVREAFPERLGDLDAAELHRRVNIVRPSLIRVQADEVTYALHIIIRFELELELFEGSLDPADLPERWNDRVRTYLGIEVPDDAHGVMQDIHWPWGAFGYFPTYALGNLIAAQIWARLREELPALDEHIAAGDFAPLRAWLGAHVHRYGRMFTPAQTLRRAVGAEIDPQPFLDYLWDKHAEIHAVRRTSPASG